MRPVALHLEGFGSFREPVDLDFDNTDFFALVGPTGAGKSTVIDAICFALYGSIPRYDDEKLVARAVTLGRSEAKVSLTFDVRAERYVATRVVRLRDGKATAKVALERVTGDGASELVADKVKPMKEAVESLLGLQFSHFTKCVVLPQGSFAQFLHDDASKRQDLLVRLLDLAQYERVARRARQLADEADHAVRAGEARLAHLTAATPEARAAAHERVEVLGGLRTELEDAVPHDEKLARELEEAQARAAGARGALRALAAVRVPEDLVSLDEQLQLAREAHERADASAADATADVERLIDAAEELGDVAAWERLRDAHRDLAGLATKREQLLDIQREQHEAVERCDTLLVNFATAVEDKRTELETLRASHAHAQLRAELVLGEPCPVCEQAVRAMPAQLPTGAVEAARAELEQLLAQENEARALRDTTQKESARAQAQLDALEQRATDLHTLLDDAPAADEVDASLAQARLLHDQLQTARAAAKQEMTAAKQAAQAARDLEQRVRRAAGDYTAQRDPLVPLGAPAPEGDDVVASWRTLAEWAEAMHPEQQSEAERADADVARTAEERASALGALAARCRASGVEAPADAAIGALITRTAEATRDAVAAAERIDADVREATKVERAIAKQRRSGVVARTLANLLRADRFERWLVTEALDVLVESASITLYRLSGGQYSLACDDGGEFAVIDHRNADERRAARTLSGGETFQASLALALALSEHVATLSADARSRLDAIFLDEGFGTLDADALETVASTIEHLGADGRMVGVVTHVPALAERVPVRFRVERNDRTSSVVREEL